jgi:two-component system chemotaxis response regulator CheY
MAKTILTVDDSKSMRELLKLALTSQGFAVTEAINGVDGLAVLRGGPVPDVIITDINMPEMNGFEFIENVRKSDAYKGIPILVLTTESDAAKKDRARKAGATGWVVKPFDTMKLADAIRRVAA